jgi:hypothetical protein
VLKARRVLRVWILPACLLVAALAVELSKPGQTICHEFVLQSVLRTRVLATGFACRWALVVLKCCVGLHLDPLCGVFFQLVAVVAQREALFVSGKRLPISVRCVRGCQWSHMFLLDRSYCSAAQFGRLRRSNGAFTQQTRQANKCCSPLGSKKGMPLRRHHAGAAVANRTFELRSWRLRAQNPACLRHLRRFRISWSSSIATMSCFLRLSF